MIAGLCGGALYSWLVTITLARSYAIAWPEWYSPLFGDQLRLGLFLWNVFIAWVPCLLIAMLIGLAFRRVVNRAALPAALLGACIALLYVAIDSVTNGDPSAFLNLNTFVIIVLLPLGVFLTQLHNKSSNADTGAAGAG